jgi:hypothetical protein
MTTGPAFKPIATDFLFLVLLFSDSFGVEECKFCVSTPEPRSNYWQAQGQGIAARSSCMIKHRQLIIRHGY